MKIQFPHDFSGEVPWRKCEGAFPEWKVPEEDIYGWGIAFSNIPQICDSCSYQEACCMQISQILLMGIPHSKEHLNTLSNLFWMYLDSDEHPSTSPIIDGTAHEIQSTKKLR